MNSELPRAQCRTQSASAEVMAPATVKQPVRATKVRRQERAIIKSACDGVKVLSNGALTKKVTVKANAFSEAAKAKIEAAGGKAEVI